MKKSLQSYRKHESSSLKRTDEPLAQLTNQLAKGGGIAFVGSVIGKAAYFGLHILLGRVLGPGAYGLYAIGTSVTGIAQSIGLLGLNQGIIRFCAMYRGTGDNARIKGTILSSLVIASVAGMLVTGILFAFSGMIAQKFFHEPDLKWIFRIFAIALTFNILMVITTSFAQSFRRIEYQQGVQNIFRPLVNVTLVGLAFLLGFRLAGALWGFVVSGILSAGLGCYLVWHLFPEIKSSLKAQLQIGHLLKFSLATLIVGISYLLLNYTDRIMLGYFRKAHDVGVYNAASATSLLITIFLGAFIAIFSPMISDLSNRGNQKELKTIFSMVTKWVVSLSLPLFLVVAIFSKSIMAVFGPEFASGWIVLILLGFAHFVNAATGPVGVLLQMTGKQNIDFFNGLLLLFTNIGLNLWLIPLYGMVGAAVATALSLICIHLLRLIETAIILHMVPYDIRYLKPLAAGALAALVGLVFHLFTPHTTTTGVIQAIIGAGTLLLAYFAVLLGLGFDQEDQRVLAAVKKRLLGKHERFTFP